MLALVVWLCRRVRRNLRVVLALSQVPEAVRCRAGWRELVGTTGTLFHLPWGRRQLVDNAVRHLGGEPELRTKCMHELRPLLLVRVGVSLSDQCVSEL